MVYFTAFIEFSFKLSGHPGFNGSRTLDLLAEGRRALQAQEQLLAQAAIVIADPLVRNQATVGGNIAHADPANDHPATMLAYDAKVVAKGPGGERVIAIDDFFTGLFENAMNEVARNVKVVHYPTGTFAEFSSILPSTTAEIGIRPTRLASEEAEIFWSAGGRQYQVRLDLKSLEADGDAEKVLVYTIYPEGRADVKLANR
mgnify:CR=1 FL=1